MSLVIESLDETKVAALEKAMATLKRILDTQVLDEKPRREAEKSIISIHKALSRSSVTDAPLAKMVLEAKKSSSHFIAISWRDIDSEYQEHAAIVVTNDSTDEYIDACQKVSERAALKLTA